ncbi:hypothetical protein DAPPUDRAFT_336914 [Daphnia pulex]|uniref:Uncharacterized protein n=1 Tax=Daphnia pulex TaxID=6669 RepID=E9I0L8_DAPPU|nr:hypothetical protein DAPPUDRAFT_336914 [Daphnia pulex]|eukprot:EFX62462.1 hypothetical protein DAPPUDRAFT_336914 [Daphnia pulex]
MGDIPSSPSSSESTKRRRALRSMSGDTLTVDLGENCVNTPELPPGIPNSTDSHGAKKNKKKRRRSRDSSPSDSGSGSSSSSRSPDRKKPRKDGTDSGGFDEPSNVAMLPRSRVRDLRRWMKEGIESKTEGTPSDLLMFPNLRVTLNLWLLYWTHQWLANGYAILVNRLIELS